MIRLAPRTPTIVSASVDAIAEPDQPVAAPVPEVPYQPEGTKPYPYGHEELKLDDNPALAEVAKARADYVYGNRVYVPHRKGKEPVRPANMSLHRFALPEFDHYEFDEDGTPYRIRVPRTGPYVPLGEVAPLNKPGPTMYALRKTGGGRRTVSKRRLADRIADRVPPTTYFELPYLSRYYFDRTGKAFSRANDRECAYVSETDRCGFPLRFYSLYSDQTKKRVRVSDNSIRRIASGKGSIHSCNIPFGCEPAGQEFIDYCVDMSTGVPYRICSPKQVIHAPREVIMHRKYYHMNDYSGRKRYMTANMVRKLVGLPLVDEPASQWEMEDHDPNFYKTGPTLRD